MANLVVTSTANSILVVCNDLSEKIGATQGVWQKKDVRFTQLGSWINVAILGAPTFLVCKGAVEGALQVDSVDGVAPTTTEHLFSLLAALIA